MKKFVILSAVSAVLAFAASNDIASGKDLILNISGTVKYQNINSSQNKGVVLSHSFNEKSVYSLISNAVANASTMSGGLIASAALPADGYIAFSPGMGDGEVGGVFYVTNKSGFFYQLSGMDSTTTNYYSWIELDSSIYFNGIDDPSASFGWFSYFNSHTGRTDYLFNDIATYNINTNTSSSSYGNGSAQPVSTALLYIHDDPYLYDDAITPYIFTDDDTINHNSNQNYLEIRGILTANLPLTDLEPSSASLSLTGTGNFNYGNYLIFGVVSSGKAQLK